MADLTMLLVVVVVVQWGCTLDYVVMITNL